jgi:hypothetical protein
LLDFDSFFGPNSNSKTTTTTTTTTTIKCPSWWPDCNGDKKGEEEKKVVVEEPAEPPKPVNNDLYREFSISKVASHVERSLMQLFGAGSQLTPIATPLTAEFADDAAKFSKEFLNVFNRSGQALDFHQAYAKFLDSLDMPEDFVESVETNPELVAIRTQLSEVKASLATKEAECLAKYTGIMTTRYTEVDYKRVFCRNLAATELSINTLTGQEFAKRAALQGQWATFLEAKDRYQSTNDKQGLWTLVRSVRLFEQQSKTGGQQFNIKISRSMTPTVEAAMQASATETAPTKFLVAGSKIYNFPRENVTFSIELGVKSYGNFLVRPSNDWFHPSAFKTYQNGPFKAPASQKDFFGAAGIVQQYLKSYTLAIEPYVVMTVDKSVEDFIKTNKKFTLVNIPFDLSTDSELTSVPSDIFENVVTITIKRKISTPLLLATDSVISA